MLIWIVLGEDFAKTLGYTKVPETCMDANDHHKAFEFLEILFCCLKTVDKEGDDNPDQWVSFLCVATQGVLNHVQDRKLSEFEFAVFYLKRSKDTEDFDRVILLDEFNFLVLSRSLDLSPQKAKKPPPKSRFYMMVGSVARGLSHSSSHLDVIQFLEAAERQRNKCWDSLIDEIDSVEVPLRLSD